MAKHPSREHLSQLTHGRLSRRRARNIVRHLLAGCPDCRRIAAESLPADLLAALSSGADRADRDYSAAFAAAEELVARRRASLERERAEAPELLREIAVQPFYRQWVMVTDNPRFRTWSCCELLLDACVEWSFRDPARALQMARLA